LERITEPVKDERERSGRGFNFFARADASVLLVILRGEYQISGLSNRLLQRVLPEKNGGQIGRILSTSCKPLTHRTTQPDSLPPEASAQQTFGMPSTSLPLRLTTSDVKHSITI
jgi:hypothetical protein